MSQIDRNYVAIAGIICLTLIAVASLVTNHDRTIVIAMVGLVGTIIGYVFSVLPQIIKKQPEA